MAILKTAAAEKNFFKSSKTVDKYSNPCYNSDIEKKRRNKQMTTEEKYFQRYKEFCKGEISREEWCEFCTLVLEFLMEENADVLKTLKEEWP